MRFPGLKIIVFCYELDSLSTLVKFFNCEIYLTSFKFLKLVEETLWHELVIVRHSIILWGTFLYKQKITIKWHNRSETYLISLPFGEPPQKVLNEMENTFFFFFLQFIKTISNWGLKIRMHTENFWFIFLMFQLWSAGEFEVCPREILNIV